jgi:hypothetical protein
MKRSVIFARNPNHESPSFNDSKTSFNDLSARIGFPAKFNDLPARRQQRFFMAG